MTDVEKLAGVHPLLASKVLTLLRVMGELGFTMMVTDGLRTNAQQQALYAKGRTLPGAIVTNADGIEKRSNHQAHVDGMGHAVDCCFVVNGKPSWDAHLPWRAYGACAEAIGLRWGGSWASLHDLPHVELT